MARQRSADLVGQIFRFGVVGLINTALGLAIILGLQNWVGLNPLLANIAGYLIGFIVGYHLHRTWTFRHAGNATERAPHYLLSVIVSYILNLATLTGLISMNANPTLGQAVAVLVYAVSSFVLGRWFAFADKKATPK